jgi:hypothetical protein
MSKPVQGKTWPIDLIAIIAAIAVMVAFVDWFWQHTYGYSPLIEAVQLVFASP